MILEELTIDRNICYLVNILSDALFTYSLVRDTVGNE